MNTQEKLKQVETLLRSKFGIEMSDVNPERIEQWLNEGEDVEAIVDEIGEKYDLTILDDPDTVVMN